MQPNEIAALVLAQWHNVNQTPGKNVFPSVGVTLAQIVTKYRQLLKHSAQGAFQFKFERLPYVTGRDSDVDGPINREGSQACVYVTISTQGQKWQSYNLKLNQFEISY